MTACKIGENASSVRIRKELKTKKLIKNPNKLIKNGNRRSIKQTAVHAVEDAGKGDYLFIGGGNVNWYS